MKKIYKYNIAIGDFEVEMQDCATILDVQVQDGVPVMWALIDTNEKMIKREFTIVGTGHDCQVAPKDYIGTFQMGMLVWHLFER